MSRNDKYVHPESLSFHLFSREIIAQPDGYYQFAERIHLSFLEPIRRDILRGQRAITSFTPDMKPWQAFYFHEWACGYFLPYIILFQQALDKFIVPFYKRLGASFSPLLNEPDQYVYSTVETIKRLAKAVYLRSSRSSSSSSSSSLDCQDLIEQADELRKVFMPFCSHMIKFYNEVERNNTPIYSTWGEENYLLLERKISKFFLANHRSASSLVTAAIYHGWGYDFKGYSRPVNCIEESPWCSDRTREEAMANFSYLFTEYLVSAWNDRYQRFKAMINCVYNGEEKDPLLLGHGHGSRACCSCGSCSIS